MSNKKFPNLKITIPKNCSVTEQDVYNSVNAYSITPRVITSREYQDNTKLPIFTETYTDNSIQITRYGIDAKSKNANWANETKLVVNTNNPTLILEGKSSTSNTNKSHVGRVTQAKVEITPIEKHLLKQAIKYLTSVTDQRVVLLDIFERDFSIEVNKVTKATKDHGGEVKFDDTQPKIHCIALYKQPDNKILIVDPSNSDFSLHVQGFVNQIDTSLLLSEIKPGYKIYTVPTSKKTGDSAELYRDCIDIAVKIAIKIAFKLSNNLTALSSKNLGETLEAIPNSAINTELKTIVTYATETPLKFLQQSDVVSSNDVYKKLCQWLKTTQTDPILKAAFLQTVNTFSRSLQGLDTIYNGSKAFTEENVNSFIQSINSTMKETALTSFHSLSTLSDASTQTTALDNSSDVSIIGSSTDTPDAT